MAARQTSLILLALGLLLVLQPVAAQYGYSYGYGGTYGRKLLSIEDFKAAGVSPLFNAGSASSVQGSRRSLLQAYGSYAYGAYGVYGRRLLSEEDEDKATFSRPGRSLLQYGAGYGNYGYYG